MATTKVGNRSLMTSWKSPTSTEVSKTSRRKAATARTPRPKARVGQLLSTKPTQTRMAPSAAQAAVIQEPLSCNGAAMVRKRRAVARE